MTSFATLAAAAALTASNAPLVGQQLPGFNGTGSPTPARFLDKDLRPVPGTPRLPRDTGSVALSPDGTRVAARAGSSLVVRRVKGGQPQGEAQLTSDDARVYWPQGESVIAISGDILREQTLVEAVDTTTLEVRQLELEGSLEATQTVGTRQLVVLADAEGDYRVVVVDGDGTVAREIPLPPAPGPQPDLQVSLRGDLALVTTTTYPDDLATPGREFERSTEIVKLDVETGETSSAPLDDEKGNWTWIRDTAPGTFIADNGRRRAAVIDPDTLDVVRAFDHIRRGSDLFGGKNEILGSGRGFVVAAPRETRRYTPAGKVAWRVKATTFFPVTAGSRVFLQRAACRDGDPRYTVQILNRRSGKLLRKRSGLYAFLVPGVDRFVSTGGCGEG